MQIRKQPERFLVALSFSGNERPLIEALAEALEARLGRGLVYYDNWYRQYFAGHDADLEMQRLYSRRTELVVVGVSDSYGQKGWTQIEYRAVRGLNMELMTSPDARDKYRILPLRVGDGDVEGIHANTIAFDIRTWPAEKTADLVIERLLLVCPEAIRLLKPAANALPARHVFLARCTPDLNDPRRPVNRPAVKRQLEGLGWTVLPQDEIVEPAVADQASLKRELQRCEAYVQLVGPHPWENGNFDRLQHEAAVAAGLKRFVFRSDAVDPKSVEPASHREWLQGLQAIVSSFDDFLTHLTTGLGPPKSERAHAAAAAVTSDANADAPPMLVRVAIHAADPDGLWDRVYPWLSSKEGLMHDQLAANESFADRHPDEPCQGFLILCDALAAEDDAQSPRRSIKQCREIQLGEKDPSRRPPVAIVYWPPPAAAPWPRLLRSTAQKLHRAQVTDGQTLPPEIEAFFDDMRRLSP